MTAQTPAERQEARRARQAMLGLKEVRGIYLPEAMHAELKRLADKLRESTPKQQKGQK